MKTTVQSLMEGYATLFAKYPTLFPSDATRDSLLRSIKESASIVPIFLGSDAAKANTLIYSRNLVAWIAAIEPELTAMGITPMANPYLSLDQVIVLRAEVEAGSVVTEDDGTVSLDTYDNTWAHGIRVSDVFASGIVDYVEPEYA